jgi:hypothetical protein
MQQRKHVKQSKFLLPHFKVSRVAYVHHLMKLIEAYIGIVGAAVMNNSFVLGIFLLLVYAQKLSWEFMAETAAILIVQVCS